VPRPTEGAASARVLMGKLDLDTDILLELRDCMRGRFAVRDLLRLVLVVVKGIFFVSWQRLRTHAAFSVCSKPDKILNQEPYDQSACVTLIDVTCTHRCGTQKSRVILGNFKFPPRL